MGAKSARRAARTQHLRQLLAEEQARASEALMACLPIIGGAPNLVPAAGGGSRPSSRKGPLDKQVPYQCICHSSVAHLDIRHLVLRTCAGF